MMSNGNLRLLVDLLKPGKFIVDEYANNFYRLDTLPDSAKHMETKSFFCKLACSHALHFLQMVDWR